MKASDIMSLGAATITPDASLAQAIRTMTNHRKRPARGRSGWTSPGHYFGGRFLPAGRSPGSAERAVRRGCGRAHEGARILTIDEIISRDPIAIGSEAPLEEPIEFMERHAAKRLPVVTQGRVVGVISRADMLHAPIE